MYPITKYHTFFPRPIFDTKTIENDLEWFEIVIYMLQKKVCILLLSHFFPRPVFDTRTTENDLKWFEIVILMLKKSCASYY